MLLLLVQLAAAETLPGIALTFDTNGSGDWVLPDPLPADLAAAGAEPGWRLTSVDGLVFDDPEAVRREVARGPARQIRLHLRMSGGDETILVAQRLPMAQAEWVDTVAYPTDFSGAHSGWVVDQSGYPGLVDGVGAVHPVDPMQGTFTDSGSGHTNLALSDLFWSLVPSSWAQLGPGAPDWGGKDWARDRFKGGARVSRWKEDLGDHLLVPTASGVDVFALTFPRGTPALPTCNPRVPETCLTSGRQIVDDLSDLPGATFEATRHLGIACEQGVYSACFEAVRLDEPTLAVDARSCVDDHQVEACNRVGRTRLDAPNASDEELVGVLEFSCNLEGAGTLGQRLRRLEDVGAGCMMLSGLYDELDRTGQALLALDQACVLGRAEACDLAAERRHRAFAVRTVRECEHEELAIAPSCVELGRLLQQGPIDATELDEFGAFLRGCSLGSADGCLALGDYVDRWGIDNERVIKAETELQAACKDGELRACLGAGHLLVRHDPKSDAYGEALVLFDRACEGNLAPACIAGARQRRIRAAKKVEAPDQPTMWQSACELHEATGCHGLGDRMHRDKEWPDAFAAWNQSCELGHPPACTRLGELVTRSHDPPWQGEQPRKDYLKRACENGDAEGCYLLASDKLAISQNPSEGTYILLERACEGEHGDGCATLAQIHLDRKTSFDDEIAARHLDSACENGHFDSCRELGQMYLRGKGVERDRRRANELLDRFRLNAPRKHVRLGASVGMVNVAGGELELVAPIPVGPAFSVVGQYSYLPKLGSVLVLLEGDSTPNEAPDLTVWGASARVYPNTQARGAYASAGVNELTASGGSIGKDRSRFGWSARVGMRHDNKGIYTGMEIGLGQYGLVYLKDFDKGEDGIIPLVMPSFAFSIGWAPI